MKPPIPYRPARLSETEVCSRARQTFLDLDQRRSVRAFRPDPIPQQVIADLIRAASTAPSGAHRQPWRFVAVSDPSVKARIRLAAEAEERENYGGRMPPDWREALEPIGTSWQKPYLEVAPWLVVAFAENYSLDPDGSRRKNYYVRESVGIACGLFIAAVHQAGLATLTHTPSPLRFLNEILGRPGNEQPMILFPVGYPAEDAMVPDLRRKALEDVAVWFTGSGRG